jgi:hypothetical protein
MAIAEAASGKSKKRSTNTSTESDKARAASDGECPSQRVIRQWPAKTYRIDQTVLVFPNPVSVPQWNARITLLLPVHMKP